MVKSKFRPEVEIRPFRACAMHPAIITGTVRSLLTWLWGRYHVPQNAFLVLKYFLKLRRLICVLRLTLNCCFLCVLSHMKTLIIRIGAISNNLIA